MKIILKSKPYILLLCLWICSCSSVETRVVDHIQPHLEKNVGLMAMLRAPTISKNHWDKLLKLIEKDLATVPHFGSFVSESQSQEKASGIKGLQKKRRIYTTTAALTDISDRELAAVLSEHLNIEQALVVYLDHYTCMEMCDSKEQFILRFQLLNMNSSEVVWKAYVHHKLTEEEIEEEQFEALTIQYAQDILQRLRTDFTIPWQQKRYQHLSARS